MQYVIRDTFFLRNYLIFHSELLLLWIPPLDQTNSPLVSLGMSGHDWTRMATPNHFLTSQRPNPPLLKTFFDIALMKYGINKNKQLRKIVF